MIYTRYGSPVTIVEAELRTWFSIERPGHPFELVAKRPKRLAKDTRIEEAPLWFVKLRRDDGSMVTDGQWLQAGHELKADDGWREIEAACKVFASSNKHDPN